MRKRTYEKGYRQDLEPAISEPIALLPSHSRRLSHSEITKGRTIANKIAAFMDNRTSYMSEFDVPLHFGLPGANWVEDGPDNDYKNVYRLIIAGADQTFQHFRHHVKVFSGCQLLTMTPDLPDPSNVPLPENADDIAYKTINERRYALLNRWQKLTYGLPTTSWIHAPAMFGEMGLDVGGPIVNYDTCCYQERIKLLDEAGIFRRLDRKLEESGQLRFLEIGGGYGALAHFFKNKYRNSSYTIVDLPPSLICSAIYTGLAQPDVAQSFGSIRECSYNFIPNYAALQLLEPFDLVINTISFSEMPEHIVKAYGAMMKNHWLADGGLLFEQNQDHRKLGFTCAQDVFASLFPYRLKLRAYADRFEDMPNMGMPNVWSLSPFVNEPA